MSIGVYWGSARRGKAPEGTGANRVCFPQDVGRLRNVGTLDWATWSMFRCAPRWLSVDWRSPEIKRFVQHHQYRATTRLMGARILRPDQLPCEKSRGHWRRLDSEWAVCDICDDPPLSCFAKVCRVREFFARGEDRGARLNEPR